MFIKAQVFNRLGITSEDIIDWAIELLYLGYDSPNLRILAGLTNLNDYWEITNYVNKTLKDFKISKLEGKTAVIAYTFVIINEFLTGKISQEKMLGDIHQLCIAWDYLEEIFDFYLLWNAVDDLRYDNVQYYWPDATRENIDIVIQEETKKWLEKYKGRICQQELTVLSKISQDMNIT